MHPAKENAAALKTRDVQRGVLGYFSNAVLLFAADKFKKAVLKANKMIKKIIFPAVFFLIMSSCASPGAVIKQGYDFRAVKSIRVGKFVPAADYSGSGGAVQNAFIRQLLAKGYNVKAGHDSEADVIIKGSVTAYVPDKKYLIMLSGEDGFHGRRDSSRPYPVIFTRDITEIGGSSMYDLGSAFGLREPNKIMSSNATVGVYAYMEDGATGEIVWSDSYTYEGLDLSSALDGAVRYILRSLPPRNSRK